MRSLIFLGLLLGLVFVVGLGLYLNHMDLSSPYVPTQNHKGDEGWPVIPAAAILGLAVVGALISIRRTQSKIDKQMYDERNVVPNENHGPHSGLGQQALRARRGKNFQYPA